MMSVTEVSLLSLAIFGIILLVTYLLHLVLLKSDLHTRILMCTLMLCVYMNTEATVQVHLDQNWFKSIWTRLGSSPPGPELVHVNLHQNWFKSTWIRIGSSPLGPELV